MKFKDIFLSFSFILTFISQTAICQNKRDTTYFVDQRRKYDKPDTTFLLSMPNEFCVYRIHYANGAFTEEHLFGTNTYRVENGVWFRLKNKKWSLFFDKRNFYRKNIYFDNYHFKLVPAKIITQDGRKQYLFYIVNVDEPKVINKYNYVLFSIDSGFVKIAGDDLVLKRVNQRPYIFNNCP